MKIFGVFHHPQKAPIYTMGSPDPRAFSRNKRGIAGSLVWINFDRHALLALINQQGGTFVANVDDIRPQYTVTESNFIGQTVTFDSTITNANGTPASATIEQSADTPLSSASGFKALATPWASDQILPFDITLAGYNEYGAAASLRSGSPRRRSSCWRNVTWPNLIVFVKGVILL